MSEFDQATGLRRLLGDRPVQVVYVLNDDTGMPSTTLEIACSLRKQGCHTLYVDERPIPNNVASWLKLKTKFDLSQVLAGDCELDDAVIQVADHLKLVSASRLAAGTRRDYFMRTQSPFMLSEQASAVGVDCCIVQSLIESALNADHYGRTMHVLLVIRDSQTSLRQLLALVDDRLLGLIPQSISVLMVDVANEALAKHTYQYFCSVWSQHSVFPLPQWLGWIPLDPRKNSVASMRMPLLEAYPTIPASLMVQGVGQRLIQMFQSPISSVIDRAERVVHTNNPATDIRA